MAVRVGDAWAVVDDEDVRKAEGGAAEACRPAASYLAMYVRRDVYVAWKAAEKSEGAAIAALRALWHQPPLVCAAARALLVRDARGDVGGGGNSGGGGSSGGGGGGSEGGVPQGRCGIQ